jgi:hypothetical protein
VWNPIPAGADHPVKHLASRYQADAALGCNDPVDERVNDRIGNASQVLRTSHGSRLRGEVAPQRVAGRAGKTESLNCKIEFEIVDALAILHGVDDTQVRLDAQCP